MRKGARQSPCFSASLASLDNLLLVRLLCFLLSSGFYLYSTLYGDGRRPRDLSGAEAGTRVCPKYDGPDRTVQTALGPITTELRGVPE